MLMMDCIINIISNDGIPSSEDSIKTDKNTLQFNHRNKICCRDILLDVNAFDISEDGYVYSKKRKKL